MRRQCRNLRKVTVNKCFDPKVKKPFEQTTKGMIISSIVRIKPQEMANVDSLKKKKIPELLEELENKCIDCVERAKLLAEEKEEKEEKGQSSTLKKFKTIAKRALIEKRKRDVLEKKERTKEKFKTIAKRALKNKRALDRFKKIAKEAVDFERYKKRQRRKSEMEKKLREEDEREELEEIKSVLDEVKPPKESAKPPKEPQVPKKRTRDTIRDPVLKNTIKTWKNKGVLLSYNMNKKKWSADYTSQWARELYASGKIKSTPAKRRPERTIVPEKYGTRDMVGITGIIDEILKAEIEGKIFLK